MAMAANDTTQQALDALTKRDMSSNSNLASGSQAIPGGESGYEPLYPNNIPTDSAVKSFITHFFEVSDDPGRNDEWVGFFDENATVIIGNDVAKGKEGKYFIF